VHPFEKILSVSIENTEFEFRGFKNLLWADFILNPRRLRGSDFLMRWSQGVWSEKRLIHAINGSTDEFYVIAYGPSSTAPSDDVKAFELYFERLEAAGLGQIKRPDLLIFRGQDKNKICKLVQGFGGEEELAFIKDEDLSDLLDMAIVAIECENSLWVAGKMPDYGKELKPMKRLEGKPGLSKTSVLPTVILKEEDREPLFKWQNITKIPIHIWHVFFDKAYGLALSEAQRLIDDGLIQATIQVFQAPGGATTQKAIYKFYYHYAYPLGITTKKPELIPNYIEDKNGHILPYITFKGGDLQILPEAFEVLNNIRNVRNKKTSRYT